MYIDIVERAGISEAKQVGRLFHFTDLHSAWAILDEKKLKIGDTDGSFTAAGGMFFMTQPRTHISLTRNPRMAKTARVGGNNEPWSEVRIVLDGDRLAQRNRIEPYLDTDHGISRQDDQAEERIKKNEVDIAGCVVQVDFYFREFIRKSTDWESWASIPDEERRVKYTKMAQEEATTFVRDMRKRGYKVNIVRKF